MSRDPGRGGVHFRTFGCKANQYDTDRMRQELVRRGAHPVDDWSGAEVCVINTCTVTNQADAEARGFIRRVRRESPGTRVVVAGCSAVLKGPGYRGMPGVTAVVEGHDPGEVARAAMPPLVQMGTLLGLDALDMEPVGGELLSRREGASRGWLKVQDGCDRHCSFCATRLARGSSRSRPPGEIVAEARLLAVHHPELVITGIHIGHYGLDLEPDVWSLSRLLALLLEEVQGVRFRLGSVEATEIDDLLLDLMATSGERVAPHLHMPLQSGADPVLRRMRRWHTRDMYRRRVLEIVERIPILGLGADVITGFPGETGGDHEETRALVEELPFTYLHVFPYSPRDGTPAVDLPDPVPPRIAGDRARELRDVARAAGEAHRRKRAGSRARVVLESGGTLALTGDYLRVGVRGGPGPSRGRGPTLHTGILAMDGGDLVIDLGATEPLN